jgi:hypothetical protein
MTSCRDYANELGKPVLHIYHTRKERILNQDSLRLEIQALTDFLCSKKIEILNVAGPRESKEPGVYEWTLTMFSLNRAVSGTGSTETASGWDGGAASRVGKSGGLPTELTEIDILLVLKRRASRAIDHIPLLFK